MIGELRSWLLAVLAAAFFLAVVQAAMPKGPVRHVGSLAAGLLLFLVMLRPLVNLPPGWLTGYFGEAYDEAAAYSDSLETAHESYLETIMSRQCAEYIVSQAAALGCTVEAKVDCGWLDGWPVPASAVVQGALRSAQQEQLSAYMQSELGIPKDGICYEEATP